MSDLKVRPPVATQTLAGLKGDGPPVLEERVDGWAWLPRWGRSMLRPYRAT